LILRDIFLYVTQRKNFPGEKEIYLENDLKVSVVQFQRKGGQCAVCRASKKYNIPLLPHYSGNVAGFMFYPSALLRLDC
jgi:hypothetical protein